MHCCTHTVNTAFLPLHLLSQVKLYMRCMSAGRHLHHVCMHTHTQTPGTLTPTHPHQHTLTHTHPHPHTHTHIQDRLMQADKRHANIATVQLCASAGSTCIIPLDIGSRHTTQHCAKHNTSHCAAAELLQPTQPLSAHLWCDQPLRISTRSCTLSAQHSTEHDPWQRSVLDILSCAIARHCVQLPQPKAAVTPSSHRP